MTDVLIVWTPFSQIKQDVIELVRPSIFKLCVLKQFQLVQNQVFDPHDFKTKSHSISQKSENSRTQSESYFLRAYSILVSFLEEHLASTIQKQIKNFLEISIDTENEIDVNTAFNLDLFDLGKKVVRSSIFRIKGNCSLFLLSSIY